jgi:hypothetical protein
LREDARLTDTRVADDDDFRLRRRTELHLKRGAFSDDFCRVAKRTA